MAPAQVRGGLCPLALDQGKHPVGRSCHTEP